MLAERDIVRIKETVELGVRQALDAYTEKVEAKMDEKVAAHNDSVKAHGGTLESLKKFRWVLAGAVAAGSGIGGAIGSVL